MGNRKEEMGTGNRKGMHSQGEQGTERGSEEQQPRGLLTGASETLNSITLA